MITDCRWLLLLLLLFAGNLRAQAPAKADSPILARESFSTIQGGKTVTVSSEGVVEIMNSNGSGDPRARTYRYSSVNVFLYMIPLGAQDQPDRLLTVWEAPTGSTRIAVLNLLSAVDQRAAKREAGRVLLEAGGFGLPSLLYVRDGELLIVGQQHGRASEGSSSGESYIVYLWDGAKYKQYAAVGSKGLWSVLSTVDAVVRHRGDVNPVVVKP